MTTVVVIGATGQIGRLVVEQALADGVSVRAQTRAAARARTVLPEGAEVYEADPTDAATLCPLLADADAVVLTHGTDSDGHGGRTFYDVVVAVLAATAEAPGTRLALMTSMNVSRVPADYEFLAWKRRAERLLRASGRPYAIVRPGWFGYQDAADHRIELLQGDHVTSARGVDRRHVAQVLLAGVHAADFPGRTVEVFSAPGEAVDDVVALLAATRPDEPGAGRGIDDTDEVPLPDEPADVQRDLS